MFNPSRQRIGVQCVRQRGLGGFALELHTCLESSSDPRASKMAASISAIGASLQICSTITYRINEMIYEWEDQNLVASFCAMDLKLILAELKAIYDFATELIDSTFSLPIQSPKEKNYRNQFVYLLRYCDAYSQIVKQHTKLGGSLLDTISQGAVFFNKINPVRNDLIHDSAKTMASFDLHSGPYAQIADRSDQPLIPFDQFPTNLRCPTAPLLVDLRGLICSWMLETALFLDELGWILMCSLANGTTRTTGAKVCFHHQRVLLDWIEQLWRCLEDASYRPKYQRLQVPNSMNAVVLGNPLRFC